MQRVGIIIVLGCSEFKLMYLSRNELEEFHRYRSERICFFMSAIRISQTEYEAERDRYIQLEMA
jgi:hypothetical protein